MSGVRVRGLRIDGPSGSIVRDLDLDVAPGECVAIVGESGTGKSVSARALLGLTPTGLRSSADELEIDGVDTRAFGERQWRRLRGRRIALVSQDALVSLDPLRRIGAEVAEPVRIHEPSVRGAALAARVRDSLARVAMPEPDVRARQYPHELSGGLRQRALIASALAAHPAVLVADEPTTALDATVQARVLALLRRIADDGVAVVFISHDLGAVARVADRVVVLHEGRVVETGPTAEVLASPRDPHTRALVAAVSHEPLGRSPRTDEPLLRADGLGKRFGDRVAVDDVSLALRRGRTLAVVGESGSGKTTLARMIVGVTDPDAGSLRFDARPWSSRVAVGAARTRVQLVQQNPWGALDPRWTIGRTLGEAVAAGGVPRGERRAAVAGLLEEVGLSPAFVRRRPRAAVGRSAPACRDRASPGGVARSARARRAGVGPRCVGAGAHPRPPARAAVRAGSRDGVHHARSRRGGRDRRRRRDRDEGRSGVVDCAAPPCVFAAPAHPSPRAAGRGRPPLRTRRSRCAVRVTRRGRRRRGTRHRPRASSARAHRRARVE